MVVEIDKTPLLVRQFAWDLFPREWMPNVWSLLDLVPEGPDGQEREFTESETRIAETEPMVAHIEVYSAIVAFIMSQSDLSHEEEVTPEQEKAKMEKYQELISCGASVIIAKLIDDGMITVNG